MSNLTNTTTNAMITYTLAYTPAGKPTFFRLGQIIPAGTMLLANDEDFVTLDADYVVKAEAKVRITLGEKLATGLRKDNKRALVAVPR